MLLRIRGWTFLGSVPDLPKLIIVGAPHTTNWDFIAFLAALHAFQIEAKFIGKHTLFRWPLGYLFRGLGGIPVDRRKPGGVVGQVTLVFEKSESLILVLAPEGTRAAAPYWKSGFIKIAEAANLPVVPASIDYARREVTIGDPVWFEGSTSASMDGLRRFYAGKRGLKVEGEGPVAVAEEGS